MKIGMICYPTLGGSGVVATTLGESLARRGHEVHFFSYESPARLDETLENIVFHPVEVLAYPLFEHPPYCMALTSRIADAIERSGLEIIHAHYAIPHAAAALFAVRMSPAARPAVVTTLHGTDIVLVGQDPSFRTATKFCLEKSDAVTAVSRWLAGETDRLIGADAPIEVIPNFVDSAVFAPSTERPGIESCVRCVHVSNFRPVKKVREVVRAFAAFRKSLPSPGKSRLWFVGEGPDLVAAEEEVRRNDLRDCVRFMGGRTAIETIVSRCHFFFMTSDFESFGLSALEAMSCAVVPIAYGVGGIPEVITDGVDGFLVEPGDWEAMGALAARAASDPDLFGEVSARARRTAVERFPIAGGVDKYENLYLKTLAARADE